MTERNFDRDLIEHARSQLGAAARRRVREGMGPASAARAAIRETQALFPHDWHLGVQGDDSEEAVEVWEVTHKFPQPITRISREPEPEKPVKLTENQRAALGIMIQSPRRSSAFYPASLRRVLSKLVEKGLAYTVEGDPYQRAKYQQYVATNDGKAAYRAALEER